MQASPLITNTTNISSAEYLAERVQQAYQSLGTNPDQVMHLYHDDIYFEDPAHGLQGKAELQHYFATLYRNVDECYFRFHQTLTDDNCIFLSWTMFLRHPKLADGGIVRVEGASYLKTRNGKIYYHRDYFDLGAMVYEHIPVLKRIIHSIKNRLGS